MAIAPDNEIMSAQGQKRNLAFVGALFTIIGVNTVRTVHIANLIITQLG